METHNKHGVKIGKIRERFVADDMKEAPTLSSVGAVETIYEGTEGQAVEQREPSDTIVLSHCTTKRTSAI